MEEKGETRFLAGRRASGRRASGSIGLTPLGRGRDPARKALDERLRMLEAFIFLLYYSEVEVHGAAQVKEISKHGASGEIVAPMTTGGIQIESYPASKLVVG